MYRSVLVDPSGFSADALWANLFGFSAEAL
jgi:hypothetical protein